METLIAGAAAMLIGLATGSFVTLKVARPGAQDPAAANALTIETLRLDDRVEAIEKVVPTLVTRQEVQQAFAQAAQAQQQAAMAAQRAEAQRARQAAVFGGGGFPGSQHPQEFNLAVGQQIDALNARLQQVGEQLGL
jgi:hypothetical protein